jgi:hypothetical protein
MYDIIYIMILLLAINCVYGDDELTPKCIHQPYLYYRQYLYPY